jgi:ABC-type multidrug transport system permease subunit
LWLKILGRVNPLSYGVDLMQMSLYARGSDGYFGVPLDLTVLALVSIAVFYLGTSRNVSVER